MSSIDENALKIKNANLEVHACLNYGGIFVDGSPTIKELELAYEFGDIDEEIAHMRRFAKALNNLAKALEQAE